jgi:4-hydroxy-4-methyl-2-oxoglutarate aldolase
VVSSPVDIGAALGRLGCSELSDAMDRLGIVGQCLGIRPLCDSFHVVGRAWTVRYGPVGHDGGTVGDYIEDVRPGDVVVLDNRGAMDATVWGDILTSVAHARGISGTVIDGVCRDVDRSADLGYPIFARGNWMRTGKDRVRVEGMQIPVSIGGIRVMPGDWVRGDGDGVVVIPAEEILTVLEVAEEIKKVEENIRTALAGGVSLREARQMHGYHTLQSRLKPTFETSDPFG